MTNNVIDISTAMAEGINAINKGNRKNTIKFISMMLLLGILMTGVFAVTCYAPSIVFTTQKF
jgi:hypothetical protein